MQEESTGKPVDRSQAALRERAIALTNEYRRREISDRRTLQPQAKELYLALASVLSTTEHVFALSGKGLRFGDGRGRVFDMVVREPERVTEPLSPMDDTMITALLNVDWAPSTQGFLDCMAALSSLALEARKNLKRKFPNIAKHKPSEARRRERVRILLPYFTDREIAMLEGLEAKGAEIIRKDREILRREDVRRTGK